MTRQSRHVSLYRLARLASMVAILFVLILTPLAAQEIRAADAPSSRLRVGSKIPELTGTDQFGKRQDFESLKGRNGLVLLFFRSADW